MTRRCANVAYLVLCSFQILLLRVLRKQLPKVWRMR